MSTMKLKRMKDKKRSRRTNYNNEVRNMKRKIEK